MQHSATKKLTLARETVRALSGRQLDLVHGGCGDEDFFDFLDEYLRGRGRGRGHPGDQNGGTDYQITGTRRSGRCPAQ